MTPGNTSVLTNLVTSVQLESEIEGKGWTRLYCTESRSYAVSVLTRKAVPVGVGLSGRIVFDRISGSTLWSNRTLYARVVLIVSVRIINLLRFLNFRWRSFTLVLGPFKK